MKSKNIFVLLLLCFSFLLSCKKETIEPVKSEKVFRCELTGGAVLAVFNYSTNGTVTLDDATNGNLTVKLKAGELVEFNASTVFANSTNPLEFNVYIDEIFKEKIETVDNISYSYNN